VPQPTKNAQSFGEGRKILDDWIPSDPRRPIYTALRTAFIERFAEYYGLLTETLAKKSRKTGISAGSRLVLLEKESSQLAGVLFSRSNLWAMRDWKRPAIVKFLVRFLKHSPGGRPVTKLHIAAQAREMRLADAKKWTWRNITEGLCDCGQNHTIRCRDNLRREVLHLEKMMRELGCAIPA
jgi:hypothetical protein